MVEKERLRRQPAEMESGLQHVSLTDEYVKRILGDARARKRNVEQWNVYLGREISREESFLASNPDGKSLAQMDTHFITEDHNRAIVKDLLKALYRLVEKPMDEELQNKVMELRHTNLRLRKEEHAVLTEALRSDITQTVAPYEAGDVSWREVPVSQERIGWLTTLDQDGLMDVRRQYSGYLDDMNWRVEQFGIDGFVYDVSLITRDNNLREIYESHVNWKKADPREMSETDRSQLGELNGMYISWLQNMIAEIDVRLHTEESSSAQFA